MSLQKPPDTIPARIHAANLGVVVLALSVAVLVWVQLWRPFAWAPLRLVSPQDVLTPSVKAGGEVVVRGTKCNTTDQAVAVSGRVFLVRLIPSRVPFLLTEGDAVRGPGCQTNTWHNAIPAGTLPGTYRIEGIETAQDGTRIHRGAWFSEEFDVIR